MEITVNMHKAYSTAITAFLVLLAITTGSLYDRLIEYEAQIERCNNAIFMARITDIMYDGEIPMEYGYELGLALLRDTVGMGVNVADRDNHPDIIYFTEEWNEIYNNLTSSNPNPQLVLSKVSHSCGDKNA